MLVLYVDVVFCNLVISFNNDSRYVLVWVGIREPEVGAAHISEWLFAECF